MNAAQKQAAFFISHGSPMLAIDGSKTSAFLRDLGKKVEKPEAIVVFSAHLDRPENIIITAGKKPPLIYDFYGFPEALYQILYPAPGQPALAQEIAQRLSDGGLSPVLDHKLGWDHGVWMPLHLMFPQADIPIVQVSISSQQGVSVNHQVGELLAPLRNKGIMLIGSGGISHNLSEVFRPSTNTNNQEKVSAFTAWVKTQLNNNNKASLFNFAELAPYAEFNHPTPEHFMPLFNILGSSDTIQAEHLHDAVQAEVLALDAYQFN